MGKKWHAPCSINGQKPFMKEFYMTSAAVIFFVLTIIAVIVGAFGLLGVSIEAIKILSMIFLALGVLSYVGSLVNERKNQTF